MALIDAGLDADPMFAKPYIDQDEWREKPARHRYIHGGFRNTDTRFSLYLPPSDQYEGRFFQYITPIPLSETISQGAEGENDKIGFSLDSGAYFLETNGGGRNLTGRPGTPIDPSIGGYRANAAAAQYSRVVAMAMYGCKRPYGYAFGGSGGAFRTIGGMENTDNVWDGAVPFVLGSPMAAPNVFTVRMYAMRVLEEKLPAIADALEVGSTADPYGGLSAEQANALTEVSHMGFPSRAWYTHDRLDLHGFALLFPGIMRADPTYFDHDFWNTPGYEGFATPSSLIAAKVDYTTRIKRLIPSTDSETTPSFRQDSPATSRGLADDAFEALTSTTTPGNPVGMELELAPGKPALGAYVTFTSGNAQGDTFLLSRQMTGAYVPLNGAGDIPGKLKVGDTLTLSNRNLLAAQTYHRHQVPPEGYPVYNLFRDVQGKAIYPQRDTLLAPLFAQSAAGSVPTGKFSGKMILLSNLHDTEAYPWQGDWYLNQARNHLGAHYTEHIRLWYADRANHGDHGYQEQPTQTVSYLGVLHQALRDVSAWVETGTAPPASSGYEVVDGQVYLAEKPRDRGGIQPIVQLLANGSKRAEVNVGEIVSFTVDVSVPEGSGYIIDANWDFDGSGNFSVSETIDKRTMRSSRFYAKHVFEQAGTHFVTFRVAAHRRGDRTTPYARIQNLDRVRIVVGQPPT